MALPKIDSPIYDLTLPLSKQKIKYRPFTVKEQRNLLMALEASDIATMQTNIEQILNNCTITENVDIPKLPLIDVEYYFLHLRAKSVGEIVENRYKCNNEVDGKECGNLMDVKVNLLELEVEQEKEVSDVIKITDNIAVKLKYPDYSMLKRIENADNISDFAFAMIVESIEYIHDGEQFYYASEASPQELMEFVESLNTEQFEKLQEFFDNLPSLKKDIHVTCSKCGYNHTIPVEGLESFFD